MKPLAFEVQGEPVLPTFTFRDHIPQRSCTYLFRVGDVLKVGRTHTLRTRMCNWAHCLGAEPQLLAIYPYEFESELISHLRTKLPALIGREWFLVR